MKCMGFVIIECVILLTLSADRSYVFVNINKTAHDAEAYCISEFGTHLATIITDNDKTAAKAAYAAIVVPNDLVFFGLYRNNVTSDWRWIDGSQCVDGGDVHFCSPTNWWINTDEGVVNIDSCGVMHTQWDGLFNDWWCYYNLESGHSFYNSFLCNEPPPRSYIFVNISMTRHDAEAYCVQNYGSNLATIITDADRAAAITIVEGDTWIGLNKMNSADWKWTDGTSCVSGRHGGHYCILTTWWMDLAENSDCAVMQRTYLGTFNDWWCNSSYTFLCNEALATPWPTSRPTARPIATAPTLLPFF